jgi:hypothetical protein
MYIYIDVYEYLHVYIFIYITHSRLYFLTSSSLTKIYIYDLNVYTGVASILFERRSATVRTHKQEVCFPGGMVEEVLPPNPLLSNPSILDPYPSNPLPSNPLPSNPHSLTLTP